MADLRYAVVTGGNKGIGFEICRRLASNGIVVVLTARDENRGLEAVKRLKDSGLSDDNLVFHQLDVTDPRSVASLADFVKIQFGKLDILVNNAGISGVTIDHDVFQRASELSGGWVKSIMNPFLKPSLELAEQCLKTNYYGAKLMVEALTPLLQLSKAARIVNVSSALGLLQFLKDFKDGLVETKGWPTSLSAYTVAKASMNAYTRILAKKYPSFGVNSVCPGFCKTDITTNVGLLTSAEGAEHAVRYAVVTGGNKGLGWGIVQLLASNGITVILTARDENRGLEAIEKLKESGLSDGVVFHQLDVLDPASIASLAEFIKTQFGKLDILVNNAGVGGNIIDSSKLDSMTLTGTEDDVINVWSKVLTENYELAEECVNTNYYGAKRTAEALIPLLQQSDSPKIINISSTMATFKYLTNEWAKEVFSNVEMLSEERIDEVVNVFLRDYKENSLETKGWPSFLSAYSVSKAAMNAHTRLLARNYPNFSINCVNPGSIKTDITCNRGVFTVEEAAVYPVKLALLPHGGPSGLFFLLDQVTSF
ncbi:(+)-neomenthol dehydrogenase isoform X2 [Jatropha curcas]|uniref:(+)-neomenthol dehydrogenase isoform X2 n=1 Tax=Jatropha curcas TaxID=180498 RepID=UPI0009D70E6D|nr:(+)-neomenthol dehydrogenase isoform X2 [Jatropha curcas]